MVARLVAVSALTLTLLVPSLSAGAVQDRGGLFHCRMAATPLPDQITVRFRLTTSVAHHAWRIRIWDNGTRVFSAIRRTNGAAPPSSSPAAPTRTPSARWNRVARTHGWRVLGFIPKPVSVDVLLTELPGTAARRRWG